MASLLTTNGIKPSDTPFITFGIIEIILLRLVSILVASTIFEIGTSEKAVLISTTIASLTNAATVLKYFANASLFFIIVSTGVFAKKLFDSVIRPIAAARFLMIGGTALMVLAIDCIITAAETIIEGSGNVAKTGVTIPSLIN